MSRKTSKSQTDRQPATPVSRLLSLQSPNAAVLKSVSQEKGKIRQQNTQKKNRVRLLRYLPLQLIPPACDNRFVTAERPDLCKGFVNQNFVMGNIFTKQYFTDVGFLKYLEGAELKDWDVKFEKLARTAVAEVLANLSPSFLDVESEWYHSMFFRGQLIRFSPRMINEYLVITEVPEYCVFSVHEAVTRQEMVRRITDNPTLHVMDALRSRHLTFKYSLLFKFLRHSVLLTQNNSLVGDEMIKLLFFIGKRWKVNYGLLICEKLLEFVKNQSALKSIPYPCLITGILVMNKCQFYPDEFFPAPQMGISGHWAKMVHDFHPGPPTLPYVTDAVFINRQFKEIQERITLIANPLPALYCSDEE